MRFGRVWWAVEGGCAARPRGWGGRRSGATPQRRRLRPIGWAWLVLLVWLTPASRAHAGPWEASTAQGMQWRIVQDSFRNRDAYLLERRYPDGTLDASFGQAGAVAFTLGPDNEGPAALRLDSAGRPWVAGASAGPGDALVAVVLRFLPQGVPDAGYAAAGRAATAPAGQRARALDLAPQPDGSAWVAGTVIDGQGAERTGWWRLGPDGRVDPRFGLGGLWQTPDAAPAELISLASGPDGSTALALRRGNAPDAPLQAWVLAPGDSAPSLVLQATGVAGAKLVWQGGAWRWQPALAALHAPAGQASGSTAAPQISAANPAPAAASSPNGASASAALGTVPGALEGLSAQPEGWGAPLVAGLIAVLAALCAGAGWRAWRHLRHRR